MEFIDVECADVECADVITFASGARPNKWALTTTNCVFCSRQIEQNHSNYFTTEYLVLMELIIGKKYHSAAYPFSWAIPIHARLHACHSNLTSCFLEDSYWKNAKSLNKLIDKLWRDQLEWTKIVRLYSYIIGISMVAEKLCLGHINATEADCSRTAGPGETCHRSTSATSEFRNSVCNFFFSFLFFFF